MKPLFLYDPSYCFAYDFPGINTNHAFANEILDFRALARPSYYKKATSDYVAVRGFFAARAHRSHHSELQQSRTRKQP